MLLGDETQNYITGLTFFITFFTILIEEKKGGPLGIKREMRN
jgi:hypothetical protein